MNVTITFANVTEITAERNGDCFITETKPEFPDDLSTVIIEKLESDEQFDDYEPMPYDLRNLKIAECASVDGRYWFSLYELTDEERYRAELESTIQMLTDCLLEMSEQIYS